MSRLAIFSLLIFAVATAVVSIWSFSTSYGGWRFGQNLMVAGLALVAVGVFLPAVEPRPEYTRNAYVTPGTHYMKVYPRQTPAPPLPEGRESLAWKRQSSLAGLAGVSMAAIIAGLLMVAVSLLLA